jgi:hypothetical protein
MTNHVLPNGFSARRNSIDRITKSYCNAAWVFALAACLTLTSCEKSNGQTDKKVTNKKETTISDSLFKPRVDIKVNRHYDEKGNMIGFDSTYSSYYSNIAGDTSRIDSVMNRFDFFFKKNHESGFNRRFNSLFFTDSLRYPDFFRNDFFLRRYELNDGYMRDMMQHMDSVKNEFYRKEHVPKKRT